MNHIQFQTDLHYLCFNHAVQRAFYYDVPIWGETTKETPRCIDCAEEEISKGLELGGMMWSATSRREWATKL